MYCKYCGKENEDNANFCRACGFSMSDAQAQSKTQVQNKFQPLRSKIIIKDRVLLYVLMTLSVVSIILTFCTWAKIPIYEVFILGLVVQEAYPDTICLLSHPPEVHITTI